MKLADGKGERRVGSSGLTLPKWVPQQRPFLPRSNSPRGLVPAPETTRVQE